MYTTKRVLAGLLLSACCAADGQPSAPISNNTPEQAAGRAAQAALSELNLELADQDGSLPAGFPFAVNDVGDLKRARIGFGFEEFQADPRALLGGRSLSDSAQSSGTWRYTVIVDTQPVGMLTMAKVNGKWEAVSMGAAGLAVELNTVAAQQQGAKGVSLRFIRVLQAASDFIEVTDSNREVRFAPLAAARTALGTRWAMVVPSGALMDEVEFSQTLRDAVSRNIAN